jgi:hypothetical protein
VRLWRRAARSKPWTGEPTLDLRLKDPDNPGQRLAHHVVRLTPQVRKGTPQVHLWFQTGGMAGTAALPSGKAQLVVLLDDQRFQHPVPGGGRRAGIGDRRAVDDALRRRDPDRRYRPRRQPAVLLAADGTPTWYPVLLSGPGTTFASPAMTASGGTFEIASLTR